MIHECLINRYQSLDGARLGAASAPRPESLPATAGHRRAVGGGALLGLALVYTSVALNLYWPWATVLTWWAITDIRRGESWFMERVQRAANPFAYWLVIGSWLSLSVLMIGLDLYSLTEN